MTKCIVIGEKPKKSKLNQIVFVDHANIDMENCEPEADPSDWDYLELIVRKYQRDQDLIFAYMENNRVNGQLYLGYWNDGVV
jgi:hypothetical protein